MSQARMVVEEYVEDEDEDMVVLDEHDEPIMSEKEKRKRKQEEAEAKRSGTTVEQLEQRRKAREHSRDDDVAADYVPPRGRFTSSTCGASCSCC
jgi:hypothetical protein